MKIAVSTNNRQQVSAHAGKCHHFMIFDIENGNIGAPTLLELDSGQTLHDLQEGQPHPLDPVSVVISASIGPCLHDKLAKRGILALLTDRDDPLAALQQFQIGILPGAGEAQQRRHPCTCHG